MSTTVYVTLPRSLEIDGLVHVQEWRSRAFAIYQNYAPTDPPSQQPLQQPAQITGKNFFHLFRITENNPAGENFGEKIGQYNSLHEAMNAMEKEAALP